MRDIRKMANIDPEHMRLICNGRVLKEPDAWAGCSRGTRSAPRCAVCMAPVATGARACRAAQRLEHGILMKRQDFREKAEQISFVKYL